jgi:Outer membrane protein beta-barrel domain
MPANEFDKNVQKTMDELKLHPSAEVWQKIEEKIQEKKKKRRVFFFILFSFIGLSLAGYGIYDFSNRHDNSLTKGVELGNKKTQGTTNKEQEITNKKPSINNSERLTRTLTLKFRDQGTAAGSVAWPGNKKPGIKRTCSIVNLVKKKDQGNSISVDDRKPSNPGIPFNAESQLVIEPTNKENTSKQEEKDILINVPDTTPAKKENKTGQETVQLKKMKSQAQSFKKLKWGINFSTGLSTITRDRFSFKTQATADGNLYSTPGTTTGSGSTPYPPAQNKRAFAFRAGAFVKKNISPRSSISVGLTYDYLADRIKTGSRQTNTQPSNISGISSYYRGAPQNEYTDRFHFIELPVIYDWRITKNSGKFLSLSVGSSVSYLLATNALVYDTTLGGIYFHDKDLFTKTHVNVISGASYHSGERKNFGWSIGPQFSFDLTRLIKTGIDRRKYFLYSGIDARIFFGKKKKE